MFGRLLPLLALNHLRWRAEPDDGSNEDEGSRAVSSVEGLTNTAVGQNGEAFTARDNSRSRISSLQVDRLCRQRSVACDESRRLPP
ncbi:hypothetical protein MESS4_330146 [Mesorhizobium sp. STM 4661]|nr:hypothetical protein MESS4_330146 [Mesorhizobium sp. STM 4661]